MARIKSLKVVVVVFLTLLLIFLFTFARSYASKKYVVVMVGGRKVLAEVTKTQEEKTKGLSGRESLAESSGMLFIFDKAGIYPFWMKGMKFPLDFIWIAGGKVVDVTEDAPVPTPSEKPIYTVYQPQKPAQYVLEVNAGFVKKNAINIGDSVQSSVLK